MSRNADESVSSQSSEYKTLTAQHLKDDPRVLARVLYKLDSTVTPWPPDEEQLACTIAAWPPTCTIEAWPATAGLCSCDFRHCGSVVKDLASQYGIDGSRLIWEAVLAYSDGRDDAHEKWRAARPVIDQLFWYGQSDNRELPWLERTLAKRYGFPLDQLSPQHLDDPELRDKLLGEFRQAIRMRNLPVPVETLGDNVFLSIGGAIAEFASKRGIDGSQLIWDATRAYSEGRDDARDLWFASLVAFNRVVGLTEDELLSAVIGKDNQKDSKRAKRWTKEQAVEKIRPLYRKGIKGRNKLSRLTDIPTGTVSNALRILRQSERPKPLKSEGKVRSLDGEVEDHERHRPGSNLPNVQLAQLIQEHNDDFESSSLEEDGQSPRTNLYQGRQQCDRSDTWD